MDLINKKGNVISQDFISGKFDRNKIKEIIENDTTEKRAGHPSLWYSIYGGFVYITNLTNVTLNKYHIS